MPVKKMSNGGSSGRRARRNKPSVADQYESEASSRGGKANIPSGFDGRRNMDMGLPAASSTSPQPNPRRRTPQPRPQAVEDRAAAVRAAERGNRAAESEARDAESLMPQRRKTGGKVMKKAKGGSFPDLNKDGKVTQADVLKGRGVKGMAQGGMCRGMGAATRGGNFSRG